MIQSKDVVHKAGYSKHSLPVFIANKCFDFSKFLYLLTPGLIYLPTRCHFISFFKGFFGINVE